jgi:hypothetical protein
VHCARLKVAEVRPAYFPIEALGIPKDSIISGLHGAN